MSPTLRCPRPTLGHLLTEPAVAYLRQDGLAFSTASLLDDVADEDGVCYLPRWVRPGELRLELRPIRFLDLLYDVPALAGAFDDALEHLLHFNVSHNRTAIASAANDQSAALH